MASNNQIELVVTVEVDKANQSIKSVNANLSSIEATATKSAKTAATGIDGMTAAMVKGATAGNLLADAIKSALAWAKSWTVGAVEYAAHSNKILASAKALGQAHGYSAAQVQHWVEQVKQIGYHTQEATHTVNRLMIANMDLSKATGLAKLAKDAAAIENIDAGEAMEKLLLAIEGGVSRGLRSMGIFLDFEKEVQREELKLGRTLNENEIQQVRYNAVMREGAKVSGAHAAASGEAEAQVKKFHREMVELREAIGQRFQENYKSMVGHLKDVAKWLKENIDLLAKFGQVALWVSGVLATYALATKIMALAKAIAALNLAAINPYALLAAGVLAAGAIVYSNWKDTQEQMEARFKEQERDALREQVLAGKAKQGKDGTWALGDRTFTTDELRELISRRRALPGSEDIDLSGLPKISLKVGNEPDIEQLKLAAAIRKRQQEVERESLSAAEQAGIKGKAGFAKDIAEVNEQVRKWTTFTDDKGVEHRIKLTRDAWVNVIDQLERRWGAFKRSLLEDNRRHLADYLKDEEEANRQRMAREAELYQARLAYNEELARRDLEHSAHMLQIEEQRAGYERDARLRTLEAYDAKTIQQKVWVEQQKAQIEVDYLEQVHEIKQRLFDLETSQRVLDYELEMKRLGYQAEEIKARITEYTQQREQLRQANQEATDVAVDAARQNAVNRTAALIRDHNRQIFDSFKRQAEGVFDALVSKSQSVWSAIGNAFKTAMLTAIKEVVTSQVARMLMQLFGAARGGYAQAGVSGGSGWASVLGGFGGIVGGGGGPIPGGSAGGWGTPPFVPPEGGASGGAGAGIGGWGSMAAGYKGWLTNLGNLGFRPERWRVDEMGNMTKIADARGVGGWKGGAMLAGGSILAMDGLRRGGWLGVGETTAGGALIGAKFGGPLGALIGGAIGFAAGIVRLFVKGATEKAREKVKAIYGVDISDKGVLKQIVDTAKQAFGGNLDMAIRSQQIRDLVELYAMSTGQKPTGLPGTVRPVDLVQSGGSLFQSSGYANGTELPGLGGLPTLDRIGGGVASGAGAVVIQLDGPATTALLRGEAVQAMADNPRAVQGATLMATRSNAGRRELTALQLSPGLLTA